MTPFTWKCVPSEVTVHQVVLGIDRFINYLRGLDTVLARLREKYFLLLVDVFVVPSRRQQMHSPKPNTSWAVPS